MRLCYIKAGEEWDKELNKYYKLLLNSLSEEGKIKLKEVQREWIIYRDKEFAWMATFYYQEMEGTMYHISAAGDMTYFIKQKVMELKGYYKTINFTE